MPAVSHAVADLSHAVTAAAPLPSVGVRPTVTTRRRATAVPWGIIAAIGLGGVLLIWIRSPGTAEHALFGARGSEATVTAGLAVTIAGIAVLLARAQTSWRQRWGVALPISCVAAGVTVLAIASIFAPRDGGDVGLGLLLALGAAGMNVVAANVARGTVPYNPRRQGRMTRHGG